nr:8049_t:CDS:10 [Entrophospora candida]
MDKLTKRKTEDADFEDDLEHLDEKVDISVEKQENTDQQIRSEDNEKSDSRSSMNKQMAKRMRRELFLQDNSDEKTVQQNNKSEVNDLLHQETPVSSTSTNKQFAKSMRSELFLKGDSEDSDKKVESISKKQGKSVERVLTFDINEMVRQERHETRSAIAKQIVTRIGNDSKYEDNLEYMDENADNIAKFQEKTGQQSRTFIVNDFLKSKEAEEKCIYCVKDKVKSSPFAIVAIGYRAYLALPNVTEMAKGHCLIVPTQHVTSTLECDDDSWDEIRMFAEEDRGVIFMETVINLKYHNHTVIECIPLPWDMSEDAPAYFKQSIIASGSEWSQNKKIIDTSKRGFRHSMVKELPYFHVWFGLDGGYGHIIEKSENFPKWFGKEIIAGICDLSPEVWRRPKKLDTKDNYKRAQEFKKPWDKWDWTKALQNG